jgi:hypothetical protein
MSVDQQDRDQHAGESGWQPQPQPPAQPKKRHRVRNTFLAFSAGFVALMLVWAIVAIASMPSDSGTGSGTSGTSQGLGAKNASKDVTAIKFTKDDEIGGTYMGHSGVISITNHSSKTSDYYIEVSIEDRSGTNVDWSNAVAMKVRPGQSARAEFTVYNEDAYKATVTEVQRTAS